MADETNLLEHGVVAQRPTRGKNYKLISICLVGVIVFTLFFADWRFADVKDIIRLFILIVLPVVVLIGAVLKKSWSTYAAFPTFIIWLSYGVFELLTLDGAITHLPIFLTTTQIAPAIIGGLCSILGIVACVGGKSDSSIPTKAAIFIVSFFLQSSAVMIVAYGWLKISNIELISRYSKLIQRYPKFAYFYENRAMAYLMVYEEKAMSYPREQGEKVKDEAMKDIDKAIASGDRNPQLYRAKGLESFFDGRLAEAVSEFSLGMPLCGKDLVEFSRQLYFRGWSYMRMRKYDSAIADLRWIRRTGLLKRKDDPYSTLPLYFITQSFLIMGQYDSAIAEWEKGKREILKLNKNNTVDKMDLGWCDSELLELCCEKGDYASALRYLNEAVQEGDSSIEIGYYAGVVYYRLGNYEEAKHNFEKRLSRASGDDVAEYCLSSLLASRGHTREALEHFDKALQLGFRFFDLVDENDDFKNLRKEPGYRKLLKEHFTDENIHAEEDTLRQIFKQDGIINRDHPSVEGQDRILVSEDLVAKDRAQAIFWMPNRQKEFRKLEQLITEK
jgi:tetratricopeptide (TPR) repeat protein